MHFSLVQDLTQPTALRFLQTNPTPEAILRHGRTSFLAQWQPRHRCGQWRPETFHRIYRSSGFLMVAEGKRESEMDS